MEAKHTPGPWIVDPATDLPLAVIQDNDMGFGICEVNESMGAARANARLIAAAPDLYAALDTLVVAVNVPGNLDPLVVFCAVERARAALAKADGGEVFAEYAEDTNSGEWWKCRVCGEKRRVGQESAADTSVCSDCADECDADAKAGGL